MPEDKQFWGKYKEHADTYDKDLLEGWNGNLDVILIFAGLFSGINGGFIVETNSALQQDPSDDIKYLLQTIANRLDNTTFTNLPPQPPAFSPSGRVIRVSFWFFSSLCFSLLAAFGAVLAKQWLLEYSRRGQTGSAVVRGRTRHYKFLGLHKWHTSLIIDSLPNILHLSLLLFFIGLIDFMWPLSHFIAIFLALFSAWGVLFFFVTSIIALTCPQSPFRTPSTVICEGALQFLSQKFPLCFRFQNDTNAHLFDTHILDAPAMTWIMENSVDESAIQSASLSITTLSLRYASECVLQQDVPGTIIRLLIAADIAAGQSAEAKVTGGGLATDIVSTRLRALYHVLRPIVLDSGRWNDLKENVAFQQDVTSCLRALKSRNLNSESSNLLWMIRFCAANTRESEELMASMRERLKVINMADAALHSSSFETLVQHAALLVQVYKDEFMLIRNFSCSVFFKMDRILWAYALSSSFPPIAVLNSITLIMIHGDENVSPGTLKQISFLEGIDGLCENIFILLQSKITSPREAIGPPIDHLGHILKVVNILTRMEDANVTDKWKQTTVDQLLNLLTTWPIDRLHRSYTFIDAAEFFYAVDYHEFITRWRTHFHSKPDWRLHLVEFACVQLVSFRSTPLSRRFALNVLKWHMEPSTSRDFPETSALQIWGQPDSIYNTVPIRICREISNKDSQATALRCLKLGAHIWITDARHGQTFSRDCVDEGLSALLFECFLAHEGEEKGNLCDVANVVLGVAIVILELWDQPAFEDLVATFVCAEWVKALVTSLARSEQEGAGAVRKCLSRLWAFATLPKQSRLPMDAFYSKPVTDSLTGHLKDLTEYYARAFWLYGNLWTPRPDIRSWYMPISPLSPTLHDVLVDFVTQTNQVCHLINLITKSNSFHGSARFSSISNLVDVLKLFLSSFRERLEHPFERDLHAKSFGETMPCPEEWALEVSESYLRQIFRMSRPSSILQRQIQVIQDCRDLLREHIDDILSRIDNLFEINCGDGQKSSRGSGNAGDAISGKDLELTGTTDGSILLDAAYTRRVQRLLELLGQLQPPSGVPSLAASGASGCDVNGYEEDKASGSEGVQS